jgi:hypothetical protein
MEISQREILTVTALQMSLQSGPAAYGIKMGLR